MAAAFASPGHMGAGGLARTAAPLVAPHPASAPIVRSTAAGAFRSEGLAPTTRVAPSALASVGVATLLGAAAGVAGRRWRGPRRRKGPARPRAAVGQSEGPLARRSDGSLEAPSPFALLADDEPGNAWSLATLMVSHEMGQLISWLRISAPALSRVADWLEANLSNTSALAARAPPAIVECLTLDLDRVIEREDERGTPEGPLVVKAVFFALSWTLDRLFEGRPIQKFWVLETVARLPYFSYITVLHLYESLGWWRTPQLRDIHNAEELNELHHLLIMESLGGNSSWFDRLLARTASVAYYWVVVGLFFSDPRLAYNFSLLVEEHAYVTYGQFLHENAEVLRRIPPPPVATRYYVDGDLYYFDKFQTSRKALDAPRRPPCDNMLDVFRNIHDDEFEHVITMKACQEWRGGDGPSPIPGAEQRAFGNREEWLKWSAEVNAIASVARD